MGELIPCVPFIFPKGFSVIQPISNRSGPFLYQRSLNERQSQSNPSEIGVEGRDLVVEAEVGF